MIRPTDRMFDLNNDGELDFNETFMRDEFERELIRQMNGSGSDYYDDEDDDEEDSFDIDDEDDDTDDWDSNDIDSDDLDGFDGDDGDDF